MGRGEADFASVWTRLDGLAVHAHRSLPEPAREAPPVVLQHGLGVSSAYLLPTGRELAAELRVWAPDLPGFGRSAKPPRALGVEALASALAAWLDAFRVRRPILVANSMGCQVAVELARREPERLTALVLVGPTVDPRARSFARQVLRLVADSLLEPPSLWPLIARDYLTAGVGRTIATARSALDDPLEEKLPEVRVPAVVVCGERDRIATPVWSAEVARLLPEGRYVEVPGAAHAVNYNSPLALARVVRGLAG